MTNRSEAVLSGLGAVTGVVRRHWVLGLLLAAGLVLRTATQVGYEPALLFIDSKKYIFGTDVVSNIWGSFDPLGYTLLLLRPVLMVADLAFVALLQHVLGVAMAIALYALMLRRGVTRWLAALAVAPVLLDAYQLNAEQTIMPDVLFEALLVTGIVLLLWQPRPGLALIVVGGLALGASAPVRQVGEALIVPALIYVLAATRGWRTRLRHGAVLIFCFALPVVGYMGYSAVTLHYGFEMSNMGDAYLYGRTAHAADCAALKIPADERPLCPSAPVDAALGAAAAVRLQRAQAAAAAGGRRHRPRLGEGLRPDQERRDRRHRHLALAVPGQLSLLPPRHHPRRREQCQPGLRRHRGRRVRPGQLHGRHRTAGLPAARRVHARAGAPDRAAGRDRRDLHLPPAPVPAPGPGRRPELGAGLPADHRLGGGRAARRGPVRVLLALPAACARHAAHRGRPRRDRGRQVPANGPGRPAAAGGGRHTPR